MTAPPSLERITADVTEQLAALDGYDALLREINADGALPALRRSTGRTAERWRLARAQLSAAESVLDAWRHTLEQIERVLAARHRHADLSRTVALLYGNSITLAPGDVPRAQRRPPAATSSAPRFNLAEIRDFVESHLGAVRSLLTAVAECQGTAERLAALLRAVDEAGGVEGAEPPRDAVDALGRLVETDPLAIRSADVATAETTLIRLRCAQLAPAIDDLDAAELHARARVEPGSPTPLPQAAPGLRARLRDLEARMTREHRADLPALAGLAAAITAARESVRAAPAANAGAVGRCAREDCGGGALDGDGICEACFRGPAPARREVR